MTIIFKGDPEHQAIFTFQKNCPVPTEILGQFWREIRTIMIKSLMGILILGWYETF
jgi:hypothetical protein